MKKILIFIAMTVISTIAAAHSGGTDANGCHMDHKTGSWHCH